MGQCVSRKQFGPSALHHDSASLLLPHQQYTIFCNGGAGQSGSKGKNREARAAGVGSASKGVATSFGFRRRVVSASRVRPRRDETGERRRAQTPTESRLLDRNGNGGSSEDVHLYGRDAVSGRSTPLARPRKEAAGVPLRTNRFGFRQSTLAKTAKVGDTSVTAEQAFTQSKDLECKYNNNGIDKTRTKQKIQYAPLPSMTTQVSPTGVTNLTADLSSAKPVTKQTIILTYQTQQYPVQSTDTGRNRSIGNTNRVLGDTYAAPRSASASRANSYEREGQRYQAGKYTLQTQQLPKPQYPAIKVLDSKSAKQVANNARKVSGSSDGSSREGSATEDSGVSVNGESGVQDGSPRARRRPRNLEMIMKGAHSFHLRELHVTDLDIMDEAVVTDVAVIPLPKLPSAFRDATPPDPPELTYLSYAPPKSLYAQSSEQTLPGHVPTKSYVLPSEHTSSGQPMSTLERYRNQRLARSAFLDPKEETKLVLDRVQCEKPVDKQNTFFGGKTEDRLSNTSPCSKESSPSAKSEESSNLSSCSEGLLWGHHAAGEALANRSQDDASIALSLSGCEDRLAHKYLPEDGPAPHPMLMKSLTLSQHNALQSMMGSMSSSNYSGTSGTLSVPGNDLNLTLTLAESKFDIDASTLSLIDDETSPADSLISQSTTESNHENLEMDPSMSIVAANTNTHVERDTISMSSSAYQTANTKEESEDLFDAGLEEQILQRDDCNVKINKDVSPQTPGTPTNASNSLSLSDGKDYFDDEIADQPALIFRKNNTNQEEENMDETDTVAQDQLGETASPALNRNRATKNMGVQPQRTSSLDTLSSIASDDLMMDMDLGHSITSLHSVEEFVESLLDTELNMSSSWGGSETIRTKKNNRLDSSLRASRLGEEAGSMCAVTRWNQLLERNSALDRQLAALASATPTPTPTPTPATTTGASLPSRTARLLSRSRANTPDAAAASPAPPADPAALVQDVVDIKTLLLQLKRVLQEPAEEHNSKRNETLDPLLAARARVVGHGNGGLFLRLADLADLANTTRPDTNTNSNPNTNTDHCADLKRQILFLQSQVEERDRMVRWLHARVERLADEPSPDQDTHTCTDACNHTCNAATQTDRLRPPAISANLLQSDNSSGLVSWNEQVVGRKAPGEVTAVASPRVKKNVANGTCVKCQCGNIVNGTQNNGPQNNGTRNNGTQNGDTYVSKLESLSKMNGLKKYDTILQLKSNARVGSRYLQAVSNKELNGKRDSSCNNIPTSKKTLYGSRSKSIENFHDQNLSANDQNGNFNLINLDFSPSFNENNSIKHHTSYSDLFCRTNAREIKSNGSSNSHLTDTDDNSDSGYKSLPPTVNLSNGKKVSGIPIPAMESRLSLGKYNNFAKTNAL